MARPLAQITRLRGDPDPEQEGMEQKALLEMDYMLTEGIWPDGLNPDEHARIVGCWRCWLAASQLRQLPAEDEKWQSKKLFDPFKSLRRSCSMALLVYRS